MQSLAPSPPASLTNLRALGPWYVAEFMNSFAVTLLTTGAYWYAERQLDASPSARLWLSAAWGFAYIFIALLAGVLTSRFGARKVTLGMIAGCIVTATVGLLALAFRNIYMLAFVMLAYNFTSSQIWPPLESAITRSPGSARLSTRTALYNLVWASAGFLAFLTVGALADTHWSLIFIVPAAASLIATTTLFAFAVPEHMLADHHVADDPVSAHELDSPAIARRANTLLIMAWIGNALAYVAINTLIPVIPTLTTNAGVTDITLAAAISAIWPLARFAGFALSWAWRGWHYRPGILLAFQTLLTLAFFGMMHMNYIIPTDAGASPALRLTYFIAVQTLFGIAVAFVYASSLYYAMHVSSGAGGHAGIHEALIGAGVALGPTIGAIAGTGADTLPRITFAVTGVLLTGTVIMAVYAASRR